MQLKACQVIRMSDRQIAIYQSKTETATNTTVLCTDGKVYVGESSNERASLHTAVKKALQIWRKYINLVLLCADADVHMI